MRTQGFAKSRQRFKAALTLCGLLQMAVTVRAADSIWNATEAYDWATAANWIAGVPGAAEKATFNSLGGVDLTARIGVATTIGTLVFNNTLATTISSASGSTAGNRKTLTIGSGGITLAGNAGNVSLSTGIRSMNVTLGASQTWLNNSAASTLTMAVGSNNGNAPNTFALGAFTLTVDGAGATTFSSSNITGTAATAVIKNGAGLLTFNSAAATFSGDVQINGGTVRYGRANALPSTADVIFNTANGTATLDLNNLNGAIASLTIDGATGTGAAITTGAGTLTLGGSVTYNSASGTPAGATISGKLDLGAATRTFEIRDSSETDEELLISATISGTGVGLTKTSTGALILNGLNTFTGALAVREGTLSANTLKDGGVNSSLGAGTGAIQLGYGVRTGVLIYTGAETTSTDRQIQLGHTAATHVGGGVIENNGGGALTFSHADFNAPVAGVSVYRNLTLGGANTGLNTLGGKIADNDTGAGGVVTLKKEGAGTWVLAGANTYNGGTTVNGGSLLVNNAAGSGTGLGSVTVNTNATLGGAGSLGGAVTINNGGTLAPGATNAAMGTLTTASLTFQSGSVAAFDLNTATTVGAGVNDLVAVNGNLAAGGTLQINVRSALTMGSPYRLFTYTGTLSGSFAVTVLDTSYYAATLDTSTPGQINVSFLPLIPELKWTAASGAWDTTTANWENIWGGGSATYAENSHVVFDDSGAGAGPLTVTLAAPRTPASLTVSNNAKAYILTGAAIGGSFHLTKQGAGTLVLSGPNTYGPSGAVGTYIRNGTLRLGSNEALGLQKQVNLDPSQTGEGNATLDLNGKTETIGALQLGAAPGAATAGGFANSVIDSAGGGLLKLGGNVTYQADIGSGFTNAAATVFARLDLNGAPRTFTVNDSLLTATDLVVAGNIAGGAADGIILSGAGTLVLSGTANTFGGDLGWSGPSQGPIHAASIGDGGGSVRFDRNNTLRTTADITTTKGITFYGADVTNQVIAVDPGTTFTVNGLVSDRFGSWGNWVKTGSGTLVLGNDNNSFNDYIKVREGTLSFASIGDVLGGNSALGNPDDNGDGTIDLGSGTLQAGLLYTGTGHSTDRGLNLAGTTGGVTLDHSGSGLLKFTRNVAASGVGSKTLTLRGSTPGEGELAGVIMNNSATDLTALTKAGTGIWTLSGANTYSGATTVNGGTLRLGNGTADGSLASMSILNSASLVFNPSGSRSYAGAVSGTGDLTKTNTGTQALSGVNTYTGVTTVDAGRLMFEKKAALYNGNGAYWNTAKIVVHSNAVAAFKFGGTGEFTEADINTLQGLGSATGGFTGGSFIGMHPTTSPDLFGNAFSYGAVIGNPGGNTLGLVKLGPEGLELTANNTYRGATKVFDGGGLVLSADRLGTPPASPTPSHLVLDNGGLIIMDTFTLNANRGLWVGGGGAYIDMFTGLIAPGDTTLTYGGVIEGAGLLQVDSTAISLSGGTAHAGNGTLILTGASAHTGRTRVSGGALRLGNGTTDGSLTSYAIDIDSTGDLIYNLVGNHTYAGQIRNSGPLTKQGAGTLTLTGANTHSGVTTISAGRLKIGDGATDGSLASSSIVNNATLAYELVGSQSPASVVSGSGTLAKSGPGTLVLSSANTYSGGTTVSEGTLLVSNTSGSATGSGSVTVTGALLGGTGSVSGAATFSTGGTLTPGGTNAASRLTCNGNVTLAATAALHINIDGPALETQYDQLVMSGDTLDISGATLDVKVGTGYTPKTGDAFVIVSGFTTLTGTFAGLPEGAEFKPVGSHASFVITYDTASSPKKIWLSAVNRPDGTTIRYF